MNALGRFVAGVFVGGCIGSLLAACVIYAGGGDQATSAVGLVAWIVSGVATARWIRIRAKRAEHAVDSA